MEYRWSKNAHVKGVSAQVAGERLADLRVQHGAVTPAVVLEDARPKGSPLHPAFEWDNKKAAERYRLQQASYIIRSIKYTDEPDTEPVRVFVSVQVDDGEDERSEYQTRAHVLSDDELRRQTLRRVLSAALGELRDFSEQPEVAPVVAHIGRVLAALDEFSAEAVA